jgi:hypothetical protein
MSGAACVHPLRAHDPEIAVKSVELSGEFHKDLADRMIVPTARKLAVSLVRRTKRFGPTRTLRRFGNSEKREKKAFDELIDQFLRE